MPYVRGTFTGEKARQMARSGNSSGRDLRPLPWWPEGICEKIDKVIWRVYLLGESGEDWNEFTAYDSRGKVLGVHRADGY